MTLLFFLASCSLFKSHPTLKNQDKQKLLEKVQLIGEGRGRLTLGQSQYIFSYESVLNEGNDWILAVEIPLHGEEVMILQDLSQKQMTDPKMESFEQRIASEFRRLKLSKVLTPEEFLKEFRSLVRFTLARKWGQRPSCQEQPELLNCSFDGDQFTVSTSEEELLVTKNLKQGRTVELVGKVYDEKKFERTDIYLYTSESNFQKKSSSLSLELFWKD